MLDCENCFTLMSHGLAVETRLKAGSARKAGNERSRGITWTRPQALRGGGSCENYAAGRPERFERPVYAGVRATAQIKTKDATFAWGCNTNKGPHAPRLQSGLARAALRMRWLPSGNQQSRGPFPRHLTSGAACGAGLRPRPYRVSPQKMGFWHPVDRCIQLFHPRFQLQ